MNALAVHNLDDIQSVSDGYSSSDFKFSVDWLSVRIDGVKKIEDFVSHFAGRFGLDNKIGHIGEDTVFQYRDKGALFYKNAVYVPAVGYGCVVFSYNLDEHGLIVSESKKLEKHIDKRGREIEVPKGKNPGIFVNISGDGCRWINSLIPDGMRHFIRLISEYDSYNVSRIDVCCDILDPNNRVVPLIQEFAISTCMGIKKIGLSCNMELTKPGNLRLDTTIDPTTGKFFHNVTVGTRDSCKGQMQLYNKLIEMSSGRLSDISKEFYDDYVPQNYWWRLEYRIKGKANQVFKQLLNDGVIAAFYKSALIFGRFYNDRDIRSVTEKDTSPYWDEFLSFLERLSVIHLV